MDIVKGQLGPEASYSLKFEGGKLKAQVDYTGADLGGGVMFALDTDKVVEAIKKAIPGQIDDMVLDLLKTALKAV